MWGACLVQSVEHRLLISGFWVRVPCWAWSLLQTKERIWEMQISIKLTDWEWLRQDGSPRPPGLHGNINKSLGRDWLKQPCRCSGKWSKINSNQMNIQSRSHAQNGANFVALCAPLPQLLRTTRWLQTPGHLGKETGDRGLQREHPRTTGGAGCRLQGNEDV